MSNQENRVLLESYKSQLSQVDELLTKDPNNREYLEIRNDLKEAISLLQELYGDRPVKPKNHIPAGPGTGVKKPLQKKKSKGKEKPANKELEQVQNWKNFTSKLAQKDSPSVFHPLRDSGILPKGFKNT
jgi:hypothetical protein